MSFVKKIEISISLAMITAIIFSIISFADTAEEIREDVLRLHVIAASDSEADQAIKLKVRDAILTAGADIFDGSVDVENAVKKITPKIKTLEETANKVIRENKFDYDVAITIDKEYFTTRTYETVTLPAGEYLSLIVKIGEGKGKNWWCVMFPPMCISAAAEDTVLQSALNEDEINLVNRNPKIEPRFKIIEMFENLKNRTKR
ncbi:MAG: stage II sporulation protein R [Clostridia bacterium]|nr:stage II sporulation protein R [Clostridia bacterium]